MKKVLAIIVAMALSTGVLAKPDPVEYKTKDLTAAGEGVTITAAAKGTVALQLTGTWSGTMQVLGSLDGTNFTALALAPVGTGSSTTSFTANGLYTGPAGAMRYVVARATAYTSGTITAGVAWGDGPTSVVAAAAGSPVSLGIVAPTAVSRTAFSNTSVTVRSENITATAAFDGPCLVCLAAYDGTGGVTYDITSSSTAPATWDGVNAPDGGLVALDGGWTCELASPGDHLHTIGQTGTVSVIRRISTLARQ